MLHSCIKTLSCLHWQQIMCICILSCSFAQISFFVCYADDKQQANLVFGQSPFRQMTSIASSIWDGSGSLKLTQSEGSWRKSSETGSTNGQLLFPSNTNLNNAYTGHDMDSLLALNGTTAEILNQGNVFEHLLSLQKGKWLPLI